MALMEAALAAVATLRPRWWALENVRGSVRFMPTYRMRCGGRYLWGNFPLFPPPVLNCGKEKIGPMTPDRARVRAKVEYPISLALCKALEAAA